MSLSKSLSRVKRFVQVQILRKENSKGDRKVMDNMLALKLTYLKQEGWVDSVRYGLPIDEKGKPLPWFTYPSIHFIKDKLMPKQRVFEYGSGNSTLWFASQVKSVVSLEHDLKWYDKMKPSFLHFDTISYHHEDLETGNYAGRIKEFSNEFDIIVIDGRQRIECARNSIVALKSDGIIIWDNSDRDSYQEGYDFLTDSGFKRLDFWGLGPINSYAWCTSIFYRSDNCFRI